MIISGLSHLGFWADHVTRVAVGIHRHKYIVYIYMQMRLSVYLFICVIVIKMFYRNICKWAAPEEW